MYTLLVTESNEIVTTKRERIMQRSNLVDNLQFLVPPMYKECDITNSTVLLEYVLPCSKKYCSEILMKSDDMYEDHLVYMLPFNTKLTTEPGSIEIQLTFVYVDLDADGNSIQRVRKTSTNKITIVPIAAWSDIVPDAALAALDQRLIKQDAQIKALEELGASLNESKADNLSYDNASGSLQLLSGENEIGNKVTIKSCSCEPIEDGVPVVDFSEAGGTTQPSEDDGSDVVEF